MKTNRQAPRGHEVGQLIYSHYWRQWDEVIAVHGSGPYAAVTVLGLTGPDAGETRSHCTPIDPRDIVRFAPRSR